MLFGLGVGGLITNLFEGQRARDVRAFVTHARTKKFE